MPEEEQPGEDNIEVYGQDAPTPEEKAQFGKTIKKLERELRSDIKNLIATELAMALYAPTPQQKLRHIFEAFDLLTEDEQYAILITKDVDKAQRYRALANCVGDLQKTGKDKAFIPFDFPIAESPVYMDFFTQWYGCLGASTWDDYYFKLASFLKSGEAPITLCFEVKTAFINTAMPFALSLFRIMFGSYIGAAELEAAMARIGAQGGSENAD